MCLSIRERSRSRGDPLTLLRGKGLDRDQNLIEIAQTSGSFAASFSMMGSISERQNGMANPFFLSDHMDHFKLSP